MTEMIFMRHFCSLKYAVLSAAAAAVLFRPASSVSRPIDTRGQVSGSHLESRENGKRYYDICLRYIPQVTIAGEFGGTRILDLEASLDMFGRACSVDCDYGPEASLYRLKLRYADPQTEIRIGLQKLNFGPATLLRSLMWFDRLDPRDPLRLAEGVYGIRFRHVALNNTSLWLWGLLGNDDPKGMEVLPSTRDDPELGGRLQLPAGPGELAFTYHHRKAQLPVQGLSGITENRYAIDGHWDVKIGLRFEAVLQRQRSDLLPFKWTKMFTLGADYTLGIGNGLYILLENMAVVTSNEAVRWDEDTILSALMANYPLGYMDIITAMAFFTWEKDEYSLYTSWQRMWDDVSLNLSVFRYPASDGTDSVLTPSVAGGGTGIQLILIFNH